ncbi:hypothetical protein [Tessaracoccus sp. SD287]|nr:hypothetical protein [Tessaracoccus sp. SD287]
MIGLGSGFDQPAAAGEFEKVALDVGEMRERMPQTLAAVSTVGLG